MVQLIHLAPIEFSTKKCFKEWENLDAKCKKGASVLLASLSQIGGGSWVQRSPLPLKSLEALYCSLMGYVYARGLLVDANWHDSYEQTGDLITQLQRKTGEYIQAMSLWLDLCIPPTSIPAGISPLAMEHYHNVMKWVMEATFILCIAKQEHDSFSAVARDDPDETLNLAPFAEKVYNLAHRMNMHFPNIVPTPDLHRFLLEISPTVGDVAIHPVVVPVAAAADGGAGGAVAAEGGQYMTAEQAEFEQQAAAAAAVGGGTCVAPPVQASSATAAIVGATAAHVAAIAAAAGDSLIVRSIAAPDTKKRRPKDRRFEKKFNMLSNFIYQVADVAQIRNSVKDKGIKAKDLSAASVKEFKFFCSIQDDYIDALIPGHGLLPPANTPLVMAPPDTTLPVLVPMAAAAAGGGNITPTTVTGKHGRDGDDDQQLSPPTKAKPGDAGVTDLGNTTANAVENEQASAIASS